MVNNGKNPLGRLLDFKGKVDAENDQKWTIFEVKQKNNAYIAQQGLLTTIMQIISPP